MYWNYHAGKRTRLSALVSAGLISALFCACVQKEETAPAGSSSAGERSPVYELLRTWSSLEIALALYAHPGEEDEEPALRRAVLERTDEAALSLGRVQKSSAYRAYTLSSFSHETQARQIQTLLDGARDAALRGDAAKAARYGAEGRDILAEWQRYDMELMNSIQLNYIMNTHIVFAALAGAALYLTIMIRIAGRLRKRERRTLAYSRNMRTAQEQERALIARELHDSLIGGLRRVSFLAYAKQDGQAQADKSLADTISAACDALIRRTREICRSLIPEDFDRLGLLASLRSLCVSFGRNSGIECRLIAPETLNRPLSAEAQFHCFRIIEEALTNVEKHAGASEVSVLVREEARSLVFLVTDDGRGFAAESSANAGLGIAGMYDRAEVAGGKLTIDRGEDGAGVMVKLEIPG